MVAQFTDHAGNVLEEGQRVCVRKTGAIGKVVSIDRYRSAPIQVQVGFIRTPEGGRYVYHWYAPLRVVVVPD